MIYMDQIIRMTYTNQIIRMIYIDFNFFFKIKRNIKFIKNFNYKYVSMIVKNINLMCK